MSAASRRGRWAWVEIDLNAYVHNLAMLRARVGAAQLWAVVKADAYGHGAVPIAAAARRAGVDALAVALVQEGVALRAAGIDGPIVVLSPQPPETLAEAIANDLELTVASVAAVAEIEAAGGRDQRVHLKVDTGMHRVGAAPGEALAVAAAVEASPATRLHGVCTHLATADEPSGGFVARQLHRFDDVLAALRAAGHHPVVVHAANSAGALATPQARYDAVRCGIATYGSSPGGELDEMCADLHPVLSLRARVSAVRHLQPGEGISYGQRYTCTVPTTVATVPIGYADGVPRRLFAAGGEVLVGGARRRIVGVVTMDQLMVECPPGDAVAIGDEVVLIGSQGNERITATEWAARLGTIAYEITCALSARLERVLVGGS